MDRTADIVKAIRMKSKGVEAPESQEEPMLMDDEDFLSDDMLDGPEQVEERHDAKPLVASIMERIKFEKLRKKH
jgi:hypothetical protein